MKATSPAPRTASTPAVPVVMAGRWTFVLYVIGVIGCLGTITTLIERAAP